MRKSAALLLTALFFMIFPAQNSAQQAQINLTVFEPLPAASFGSFVVANDLEGAPKIFHISIIPEGQQVILQGMLEWEENPGDGFELLFKFTTRPFTARSFYNDELGVTDIQIADDENNEDAIDRNLARGKPSGRYRITVALLDEQMNQLDVDSKLLEFLNPAQTLQIIWPVPSVPQDPGNVVAQWTAILGASDYLVNANVRRNPSESLEEALNSGTPLIDNASVGNSTSANLRDLLQREWQSGQEIVLQVSAVIPGPGGGEMVHSDIVNFHLTGSETAELKPLINLLNQLFYLLPQSVHPEIMARILNGEIQINDFTYEDGTVMTMDEIMALLSYLISHPDNLIGMRFED